MHSVLIGQSSSHPAVTRTKVYSLDRHEYVQEVRLSRKSVLRRKVKLIVGTQSTHIRIILELVTKRNHDWCLQISQLLFSQVPLLSLG